MQICELQSVIYWKVDKNIFKVFIDFVSVQRGEWEVGCVYVGLGEILSLAARMALNAMRCGLPSISRLISLLHLITWPGHGPAAGSRQSDLDRVPDLWLAPLSIPRFRFRFSYLFAFSLVRSASFKGEQQNLIAFELKLRFMFCDQPMFGPMANDCGQNSQLAACYLSTACVYNVCR